MITFSSLINIIFFSSMAIIFLKVVFRNNNAILYLDIRFLLICMLCILFRLFIPIELPITNSIPVQNVYPEIYMFLKKTRLNLNGMELSIMTLYECIWFMGILIAVIKLICSYEKLKSQIEKFQELQDDVVIKIAKEISIEHRRKMLFKLVRSDSVYTPFVFGIIRPYIVIPAVDFTRNELQFILKHEMFHYYRGDMVVKLLCEILKAIYWWNPFVYMLGDLVADMQEINVDFKIIGELPEIEQLNYSDCLVKVAKKREKMRAHWLLAFQNESPMMVHKRISLMLKNLEISKKKTLTSIFLSIGILFIIVLCPNIFIFEPYSISDEDAQGTFGTDDSNIYYIRNNDGTYGLYLNGRYAITVTEIATDENVQVYDNLKEVKGNG